MCVRVVVLYTWALMRVSWKSLLNITILDDKYVTEVIDMQIFGHQHEEKLKCPYKGCEKTFDKPTVITDTSVLPRQTHYACPYCMSKLNMIMDKEKILEIKPTEYSTVLDSPAKCAIFSGLLQPGQQILTMDECLICPKVLQCNIRKK